MSYVLSTLAGIIIGLTGGWYSTQGVPKAPFSLTYSEANVLGMSEHSVTGTEFELYGFQPFWLLDFADQNYNQYITRFNYFGLQLAEDGSILTRKNSVELEPGWANLQSKRVQTILDTLNEQNVPTAITVQMVDEGMITTLLTEPEIHARTLIDEIEPVMKENGFTELNIDIESFAAVDAETQNRFTRFMKVVYEEVKDRELGLVSIDVTPISLITQRMTDLAAISPYTDLVILMTYDYHYGGSPSSGPVAPIGGAGYNRDFDVLTAVRKSVELIPSEKILLGIPTYGYEWKTLTPEYSAPAIPGSGIVRSQRRIEEELATCFSCTVERDQYTRVPYIIFPEEDGYHRIAYYEDAQSIQEKFQIIEEYNLRGAAIWSLGYENISIRSLFSAVVE